MCTGIDTLHLEDRKLVFASGRMHSFLARMETWYLVRLLAEETSFLSPRNFSIFSHKKFFSRLLFVCHMSKFVISYTTLIKIHKMLDNSPAHDRVSASRDTPMARYVESDKAMGSYEISIAGTGTRDILVMVSFCHVTP